MPNAGLPDPATGAYTLSPEDFCRRMEPCLASGVCAVGGCCGTTPDTIRQLTARFKGQTPAARPFVRKSVLASGVRAVEIDRVMPIGERINPTGKKRLQAQRFQQFIPTFQLFTF
jgi:5-methyltetrahydrofolate--homocysteine methyltransferase